jgi:hypothetical protein
MTYDVPPDRQAAPTFVRTNLLQRLVTAGTKTSMGSISPSKEFGVAFEDDGEQAYFYALNGRGRDNRILDVVNIYTVDQASDPVIRWNVQIIWTIDGTKVMLLMDGYPHAVFDFRGKRGYCRSNYPNVPRGEIDTWQSEDHSWNDSVLEWFP